MDEYRERLMQWEPSTEGFSHDEKILAVGLQCKVKQFAITDILSWLDPPDISCGNAAGGHIVYFYKGPNDVTRDDETAYMFDIDNGQVVAFGSIARYRDNAVRPDGKTYFNVLDEMEPFDEALFLDTTA